MTAIDKFYEQHEEPHKSLLLTLRRLILQQDTSVSEALKYGMPFFCYKGKMFCYLWIHKKYKQCYIGMVEGKYFDEDFLLQEERSRMKIMLIDAQEDLPVQRIAQVLQKALNLYRTGAIKVKRK